MSERDESGESDESDARKARNIERQDALLRALAIARHTERKMALLQAMAAVSCEDCAAAIRALLDSPGSEPK